MLTYYVYVDYQGLRLHENLDIPLGLKRTPNDENLVRSILTIKQILNYSPEVTDTMDSCNVRAADAFDYDTIENRECFELFSVSHLVS